MTTATRQGYLLIADISGYTAFLTGSELEHAHGVIADLTGCVVRSLTPPLRLAKLEGDAVFCTADATTFPDGERVLELIEAAYVAFLDRIDDVRRTTTCTCAACANIGTLDLKFVAHFGSYIEDTVAGTVEVSGPDVILVHRLLKNNIAEAHGGGAYAFLSQAYLARFASLPQFAPHSETYESFGAVTGGVHDLARAAAELRDARRVIVSDAEADVIVTRPMPAPPQVVWSYFIEPAKRLAWDAGMESFDVRPNGQGRMRAGAESHCAHGSWASVVRYLDVRPFSYITTQLEPTVTSLSAAPPLTMTVLLDAASSDPAGTLVRLRARMRDRGAWMKLQLLVLRPLFRRSLGKDLERLAALLAARDEEPTGPS